MCRTISQLRKENQDISVIKLTIIPLPKFYLVVIEGQCESIENPIDY